MIFCGIALGGGAIGAYILWRRKAGRSLQKAVIVFCAAALLGLLAGVMESKNPVMSEEHRLERKENGEGDYTAVLELEVPGLLENYDYEVTILEQRLTKQEEEDYLKAAIAEIDRTFIGVNESLNEIRERVVVSTNYQDGKVHAEWSFDNYRLVDANGEIIGEDISPTGEVVCASAELTCEDTTEDYMFYFRVFPPQRSETEKIEEKLNDELTKENGEEDKNFIQMPEKIDDYVLHWTEKDSHISVKILFLGIVLAFFIPLLEESRRKEAKKVREELLLIAYPDVVSKLTLLLGAGMTLLGAWRKIATSYEKKRKNNTISAQPVYEEMLITCHEIESGIGEATAYERFGERCGLQRYRKFGSLLSQNLKKGNKGLTGLLETEVEDAFAERKNLAKKYGEEAGTKLLLPMMIMFGIVVFLIMIPAVISFRM